MAHFHVTKQENQLEMSYKKMEKFRGRKPMRSSFKSRKTIIWKTCLFPIGAGKLKAENITVMERLGLEVGAGKAKLKTCM